MNIATFCVVVILADPGIPSANRDLRGYRVYHTAAGAAGHDITGRAASGRQACVKIERFRKRKRRGPSLRFCGDRNGVLVFAFNDLRANLIAAL
jgi:hypothetical protein